MSEPATTVADDQGDLKTRVAALVTEAIGYHPVLVSGHTNGEPWGGMTYRTVTDRDDLVTRITAAFIEAGGTLPEPSQP